MTAPNRDSIITIVYNVMSAGGWWTLPELEREVTKRGRTALQTSLSARLRDLRKPPWNRHVYSRVRAGTSHLEEYSVMSDDNNESLAKQAEG